MPLDINVALYQHVRNIEPRHVFGVVVQFSRLDQMGDFLVSSRNSAKAINSSSYCITMLKQPHLS